MDLAPTPLPIWAGHTPPHGQQTAATTRDMTGIRHVMTRYDHLPGGNEAPELPPLPELRDRVATLHQDYQGARY